MEPFQWTPDNWIAIAAIGASIIISIAGFLFNYWTNKQNIRARRTEIVTEKSIEAFREAVEKLNMLVVMSSKKDTSGVVDAVSNCNATYHKYRLYLPDSIGFDYLWVVDDLRKSLTTGYTYYDNQIRGKSIKKAHDLMNRMQKHMGVEKEEGFVPPKGFTRSRRTGRSYPWQ